MLRQQFSGGKTMNKNDYIIRLETTADYRTVENINRYHESSVIESLNDEEKFKLFDAEFPPKIKAWQPSQEEFFIHSHSVFKNNK